MEDANGPRPSWEELLHIQREVSQTARWISSQVKQLASDESLTDQEFLTMAYCSLGDSAGTVQRELAEQVGISTAGMSGLVEQLRGKGLLVSQRCQQDRRRVLWRVSTQGQQLLDRNQTQVGTVLEGIRQALSGSGYDALLRSSMQRHDACDRASDGTWRRAS